VHSRSALFFLEKELRTFALTEIRAIDGANPVVEGHAAVFNQKSHDMGFREIILPGAFAEAVLNDDVKFLLNHRGLPLARTKSGTLKLDETQRGLHFHAEFDGTDPDVQRLMPKVRRGDLSEMSFAFGIKDRATDEKWSRDKGEMIRSLLKVSLFDVSAVSFPAYPATDLQARSYFAEKINELQNPDPALRAAALPQVGKLAEYIDDEKVAEFLADLKEARRKFISTLEPSKRRFVYVCKRQ